MRIQEHVLLKNLTTLKIGGTARYFCAVETAQELREAFVFAKTKKKPVVILGGGSNVLIANGEINALVVKVNIRGVEWMSYSPLEKGALPSSAGGMSGPSFIKEVTTPASAPTTPSRRLDTPPRAGGVGGAPFAKGDDTELVVAGAGESWDALVAQAVGRGLWGVENLSGIPGTVGAAPIQNIGAYGTEVKNTIEWVEVFDTKTGKSKKFSNEKCEFGYRDSIFKHPEGKSLIVTRVALRLKKSGTPNLEYKDLKNYFGRGEQESRTPPPFQGGDKRGGSFPSLEEIRRAVLEIRSKKFPDLREFGTAGSFFKNPVISKEKFDELKKKFPNLPGFELRIKPARLQPDRIVLAGNSRSGGGEGLKIKIPLAWILDNVCGLKGYRKGDVALFEQQPVVLVNFGNASAKEIQAFAKEVSLCVKEKTDIEIEWEVQSIC